MVLRSFRPGNCIETGFFLFIIFCLIPASLFSQNAGSIDIQKIPQRTVRNYIVSRSYDRLIDFSSIQPSWKNNTNKNDFKVIEETFFLRKKMPLVWDLYLHTSPLKIWNGRSYGFALLVCKCPEAIIYSANSSVPCIDTGQVYFLNLKLLKGLFNIPVAFEIIKIDTTGRVMELSYIDNNISLGKQTLKFIEEGNRRTRIVHTTYFKSESWVRDKIFYPYFHHRFLEDFHRHMRKMMKNSKRDSVI